MAYSVCWDGKADARLPALPSLTECNGLMMNIQNIYHMARVYDGPDSTTPGAWPLWAPDEQLAGLPPTKVVVAELDPFRDEGLALARKMQAAGVRCDAVTMHGATHLGPQCFPRAMPFEARERLRMTAQFALDLAAKPEPLEEFVPPPAPADSGAAAAGS